jgi:hypothetical protein
MMRYLAGLLLLLAACSSPEANVSLSFEGKELVSCEKVQISELLDGQAPGGFKMVCPSPKWQMSLIYDTQTRKDGTINSISLSYKDTIPKPEEVHPLVVQALNSSLNMSPAISANNPDGPKCDSAKALNRTTGEAPIPRKGKGLEPGEYKLALSEPCGTLTLTVK